MSAKPDSPKGAEIRGLRESFGISQTQAAEMVYSTLRTWQNWEAEEVSMHPAIWAWFKHCTQTAGSPGARQRSKPAVKYVRRMISFWWNPKDKSIHVTTPGTEPPLHTTFDSDPTSERWHRSMFEWLRKALEANDKPTPPKHTGFQTKVTKRGPPPERTLRS